MLRHFLKLERQVRFKIRNKYGISRTYIVTVRALSLLNWLALRPFFVIDCDKLNADERLARFEKEILPTLSYALIPLLIAERLPDKVLERIKLKDIELILQASKEVNDYIFLIEHYIKLNETNKSEKLEVTIEDVAFQLAQYMQGQYRTDEVLRLPAQTFLALIDLVKRHENIIHGRPAEAEPLSAQETSELEMFFGSMGLRNG